MYTFPNFEPVHCSRSNSNCCFLTCMHVSQEAGKVVWYFHLLKNFPVCWDPHKGFSIVNEAEVDVFLEFCCFFFCPMDVGNLVSGSSAFSKSSLFTWKFSVHVLLKPSLKDFDHYLVSMWNESNCVEFQHSLALTLFETGMKTDLFQFCGHCWVFQICWYIECSTFTVSSFMIRNSSTGFHHLH